MDDGTMDDADASEPPTRASHSARAWRILSFAALAAAVPFVPAIDSWRRTDLHGDYVTGFVGVIALFGMLVLFSAAGLLFGVVEVLHRSEDRDRWTGAALWANLLFAMIAVAALVF